MELSRWILVRPRVRCMEAAKRAVAPARDQLHDTDADGLREIAHAIERFDRNCDLGHAAGVVAGFQDISDHALVTTDCRFALRAVNDQAQVARSNPRPSGKRQCGRPPAQRRMIRNGRPISNIRMMKPINPSLWRSANRNTARNVRAVSMARSDSAAGRAA